VNVNIPQAHGIQWVVKAVAKYKTMLVTIDVLTGFFCHDIICRGWDQHISNVRLLSWSSRSCLIGFWVVDECLEMRRDFRGEV